MKTHEEKARNHKVEKIVGACDVQIMQRRLDPLDWEVASQFATMLATVDDGFWKAICVEAKANFPSQTSKDAVIAIYRLRLAAGPRPTITARRSRRCEPQTHTY